MPPNSDSFSQYLYHFHVERHFQNMHSLVLYRNTQKIQSMLSAFLFQILACGTPFCSAFMIFYDQLTSILPRHHFKDVQDFFFIPFQNLSVVRNNSHKVGLMVPAQVLDEDDWQNAQIVLLFACTLPPFINEELIFHILLKLQTQIRKNRQILSILTD